MTGCMGDGRQRTESGDDIPRELGRKLSEVSANKKKIYLTAGIRSLALVIIFFCCGGGFSGLKEYLSDISGILFLFVMFVVLAGGAGLYTLRHLKERMEFYEYGIRFCGRIYYFSELGSISFRTVRGNQLFQRTKMDTNRRSFDVTYLDGCHKMFNRTYMNQ